MHTRLKVLDHVESGSSQKRAAQQVLPLTTTPLQLAIDVLSASIALPCQTLACGTAPQRDRTSTRKFELRTAPELARARFDLVCRRTDGRRRESVQGRATTREQLGNVRNVVAFLSPRLQLLQIAPRDID